MKIILRNNRSNEYNWLIIWYHGNILVTDRKWYLSKYSIENTHTLLNISSELRKSIKNKEYIIFVSFHIAEVQYHRILATKVQKLFWGWPLSHSLNFSKVSCFSNNQMLCLPDILWRSCSLSSRGYKRVYAHRDSTLRSQISGSADWFH